MYNTEESVIQTVGTTTALLSLFGSAIILSTLIRSIRDKLALNLKNMQLLILSSLDFLTAMFFLIGYAGTMNNGFCKFQALMIQFGTLSTVIWHSLIAYQLHFWVIKKKNEKRVIKKLKKNAKITIVFTLLLALILLATGLLGETSTWCWIREGQDWAKFLFFYLILFASWCYCGWIFFSTTQSCNRSQNSSEMIIRQKMQEHLVIFVIAWIFGAINFISESIAKNPVFITGVLQALFVPLQGFLNAVVYGDLFAEDSVLEGLLSRRREKAAKRRSSLSVTSGAKVLHSSVKNWNYIPREISIFTTTLNLGEAPFNTLGNVSDWLRDGHDIYAIGVQECMCLEELRAAMHSYLGGEDKFVMYKVEIGNDNKRLGFHGFIALTVFVRKEDIAKGYIRMTEAAGGDVANGADLVVTTAANKGAVGIPLRIHDTSIGFVTTHLPSDSKGKSKLPKRNGNARSMLKDVVLAADDLGVDVHHTMDHIVLMGDLNYRTKTPVTSNSEGREVGEGASALLYIAEACSQDMMALQSDPLWFNRKYNLLHAKRSTCYPKKEELTLIEKSEVASMKAWDDVLKFDELVEMMQMGEVFYGFREMMPRFPPTYKRKMNEKGSCGDYSSFDSLIRGFSHTGEDVKGEVNHLLLLISTLLALCAAIMLDEEEEESHSLSESYVTCCDLLMCQEDEDLDSRDSLHGMDDSSDGRFRSESVDSSDLESFSSNVSVLRPQSDVGRQRSSTDVEMPAPELLPEVQKEKTEKRRSSVFSLVKSMSSSKLTEARTSATVASAVKKMKDKRRTSVFDTFKSEEQLKAMDIEKAKSKLRPPSYTDRILTHSLRRDKLLIDAYGFCDAIRCSDHRPVSLTMTLTVNSEILPPNPEKSKGDGGMPKVSPHAILLNIKMSDLDVAFKRAGEVANPLTGSNSETKTASNFNEDEEKDSDEESQGPKVVVASKTAKVSSKPVMESFTEDEDEDEGEEDSESEGGGPPQPSTVANLFNSNWFEESEKSARSRKKGRASTLSVAIVSSSDIAPFEIASDIQPAEIIVICPLPTKDPLIEYRKMYELMKALGKPSSQTSMDIGGLTVSKELKQKLLQTKNSFTWSNALQGNIDISSCGDVSLGLEAIVKLIDNKGEDMGEALINLSEIMRSNMYGRRVKISAPISHGGQFRGKLEADFTVEKLST